MRGTASPLQYYLCIKPAEVIAMSELALFGIEVSLVLSSSLIVLIYIGRTLRNILTEICGTNERADFWVGFIKLTFFFLPLLIVLFVGGSISAETSLAEGARRFLTRLLLGELTTLSVIGFVLWRTIATKDRNVKKEG